MLTVLQVKPGAVRNSYALRQMPQGIQKLFDTYFSENPKSFVELLIWARDNHFDYQELCSAVNVAKMNGVHTINFESIKNVLSEVRSSESLFDKPWNQSIENGAEQNLMMLGNMFKSNTENALA